MEPEEDLLDFMEKETGGSSLRSKPSPSTFQEKLMADQAKNNEKENDVLNKSFYGEDYSDLVTQMDHGDLLGTQEGIQLNDSDEENVESENNDHVNNIDEVVGDGSKMEIEISSASRSVHESSQKGPNIDDNTPNSNNIPSGEERMAQLLDALDDLSQDIISTPAPNHQSTRSINSFAVEPKNSTSSTQSRTTSNNINIEEDSLIESTSNKPDLVSNEPVNNLNTKEDVNMLANPSQKPISSQQRKIFKAKVKRPPNAIGPGSQDSQNEAFLTDNSTNDHISNSVNASNTNQKKFSKQNSSGGIQTDITVNNIDKTTSNVIDVNNINNTDGDDAEDIPPSTQSRALPIWFSSKTTLDKQTVTSTKERQKLKSELRNRLIEGWKSEGISFSSATSSTSSSGNKGPSQAVINRAPFCEITDDITTIVKGRAVIFDLETSGTYNFTVFSLNICSFF